MRPCAYPRCPNPAHGDDHLCRRHRAAKEARRGSSVDRGYGGEWPRIRAAVLAEDPYCRMCREAGRGLVPATDVDHIRPIAEGGTHERRNLRPLCHACHARHTAITRSGWGAPR